MNKQIIRAQLRQARAALPLAELNRKSAVISQRVLGYIDWTTMTRVHCFTSMPELNEVDTASILEQLQTKGIELYTSQKVDGRWQQGRLEERGFMPLDAIPPMDIILIPMLGFDDAKHRIGYGQGWYDAFLADQPKAIKVGLCLEMGHLKTNLPTEAHDVALDVIITEELVWT